MPLPPNLARKLDFGRKLLLSTAGGLALALPRVFGLVHAPQIRAQEQAATTGTAEYDLEIEPKADKPEPDGLSIDQSLEQSRTRNQRVLQAVLADRFNLKLHPETRELSTYALVVADDGLKLQPAKPASSYPDPVKGPQGGLLNKSFRMLNNGSQTGMEARGIAAPDLASQLSRQLGSMVVDKTGLTGNYDFTLNWKSDGSVGDFNVPVSDASASSLLTAIQEQLGLKVERKKPQCKFSSSIT